MKVEIVDDEYVLTLACFQFLLLAGTFDEYLLLRGDRFNVMGYSSAEAEAFSTELSYLIQAALEKRGQDVGPDFSVRLTCDQALVLYEWLARTRVIDRPGAFKDEAERRVLWDLEMTLESLLNDMRRPDDRQLVMEVRDSLRVRGPRADLRGVAAAPLFRFPYVFLVVRVDRWARSENTFTVLSAWATEEEANAEADWWRQGANPDSYQVRKTRFQSGEMS